MGAPEALPEAIPLRMSHTVIVVDDDPAILRALKRLLQDEPYRILLTESPEQALEWVQAGPASLVISDQRMPGMSGTDLLEKISQSSPRTARVILTGFQGQTVILRGVRRGIELLLYKPWNDDSLKRMIRWILHRFEVEKDLEGTGKLEKQETEP